MYSVNFWLSTSLELSVELSSQLRWSNDVVRRWIIFEIGSYVYSLTQILHEKIVLLLSFSFDLIKF